MIGITKEDGGLYYFKNDECVNTQAAIAENVFSDPNKDVMMWHRRLGHPNFHYLKRLFPVLFSNKNPSSFHCDICQLAKHTHTSYPAKPYTKSHPFILIHSDIWGSSRVKISRELDGSLHLLMITPEYVGSIFLKKKPRSHKIFKTFTP